jgi:small conductance mechanosensitive channel
MSCQKNRDKALAKRAEPRYNQTAKHLINSYMIRGAGGVPMPAWLSAIGNAIVVFFQAHGWVLLRTVVIVAVVVIAAGPVARKADHWVRKAFFRLRKTQGGTLKDRRAATVGTLAGSIVRYGVWGLAVALCLSAMGLSSEAGGLLATAGISAGLIIGLGAQKLVQDFVAGFIYVLDHPFAVGDFVTIDGRMGTVEALKLRTTTLTAFTGERHVFPNGSIGVVTNHSVNDSLAICDVYVPANRAYEEIESALTRAAATLADDPDVVEAPTVLGVTAFTDRGMMCIRTICKTKPLAHWGVERALRAAQLGALVREGVLGEAVTEKNSGLPR